MGDQTPRKLDPQRLLILVVVLVIAFGLCGAGVIVGLKVKFGDGAITFGRAAGEEPEAQEEETTAPSEAEVPLPTTSPVEIVPPEPAATEAPAGQGMIERARQYQGDWVGQWTNLTFSSSGEAVGSITVDDTGEFTFVIDLGGFVFGMVDPPPMTYVGQIGEQGAFLEVLGDPTFGDITMTVTPDGEVTIIGEMVPVEGIASLSATGTISPTEARLEYTVNFTFGDPARGEVILQKMP
ncbi:MAG: hypothetical protein PVF70_00420 [Anaerolineales bacterium]